MNRSYRVLGFRGRVSFTAHHLPKLSPERHIITLFACKTPLERSDRAEYTIRFSDNGGRPCTITVCGAGDPTDTRFPRARIPSTRRGPVSSRATLRPYSRVHSPEFGNINARDCYTRVVFVRIIERNRNTYVPRTVLRTSCPTTGGTAEISDTDSYATRRRGFDGGQRRKKRFHNRPRNRYTTHS